MYKRVLHLNRRRSRTVAIQSAAVGGHEFALDTASGLCIDDGGTLGMDDCFAANIIGAAKFLWPSLVPTECLCLRLRFTIARIKSRRRAHGIKWKASNEIR